LQAVDTSLHDISMRVLSVLAYVEDALRDDPENPDILAHATALRGLVAQVSGDMRRNQATTQTYEAQDIQAIIGGCEHGPTVSTEGQVTFRYCGSTAISDAGRIIFSSSAKEQSL
jgi:hypothetical protein